MADTTAISWTDRTFNPIIGCEDVGPGCKNCYAAAYAKRVGRDFAVRTRTSEAYWLKPLKWNDEACAEGKRIRVFCASLSDVFDNKWPLGVREDLWALIVATPWLDWQILTKRIGNAARFLPSAWAHFGLWPRNLWLGATVVYQEEATRDIAKLLDIPARVRFLSCEPLLGPIDLRGPLATGALHWVIAGGESGPGARPMHADWARGIRDQCAATGVPFHFKQWGEWATVYDRDREDPDWRKCPDSDADPRGRYLNLAGGHGFHGERVTFVRKVGKKRAGHLLDGREHLEFPK